MMFGHQDDDQNNNPAAPTEVDDAPTTNSVTPTMTDDIDDGLNDDSAAATPAEPTTPVGSTSDDSSDAPNAMAYEETGPTGADDLLDIKKKALEELSPLVGHLNQTPEEKFKTAMMMIQGNDNQSLIPEAYKAAKEISDDKARAQALLDIVNEINYFTHKN